VAPSHSYTDAGIYTVCLTVNDGALDSDVPSCTMAVVYDPSGGFVSGGGWITSPVNPDYEYMQVGGKATFGFVAKYKKGANVPEGNTQFKFKAGDLEFNAMTYEWLVVAGNKAQFKGEGTINGQGSYKFLLSADDATSDTFRIHIWEDFVSGDDVTLYGNGSQQPLGGGSIVVHK
jgi:PKD repeat protein